MGLQKVEFQGIIRNLPDDSVKDGALHELINLRPRDGALRPVGAKSEDGIADSDIRFVHWISETVKAYFGPHGSYLAYWISNSGVITGPTDTTILYDAEMKFAQLQNTVMVSDITNEVMYLLLFSLQTQTYEVIEDLIPDLPLVSFNSTHISADDETPAPAEITSSISQYEATLGEYNKMKNSKADLGYLSGAVLIRCAWELVDGTLVKQSLPDLQSTSIITTVATYTENLFGSGQHGWSVQNVFTANAIQFAILCDSPTLAAIQSKYANIIRGLKIYVTNPLAPGEEKEARANYLDPKTGKWVQGYIDSGKVVGEKLSWWEALNNGFKSYSTQWVDFGGISEQKPDVNNMSYFLLKDYKLSELVASTLVTIENETVADLPTREQMSVNNLSHHKIYGKRLFTYNERLFLGAVKNTLFSGYNPTGWISEPTTAVSGTAYNVGIEFDIVVSSRQTLTVFSGWSSNIDYYEFATSKVYFWLQYFGIGWSAGFKGYWGYPDARATKARVFIKIGSTIKKLSSEIVMESYPELNFSLAEGFAVKETFASLPDGVLTADRNSYWDLNRVQASDQNNPFYYPAINSYRVGNTEILGMSANTIALSQGQFGQFPIITFTTEGIWALNIGADINLIDSIRPISREVCNNPDSIMPIDGATVFSTDKGLYVIVGAQTTKISEQADGSYASPAAGNANYLPVMSDPNKYEVANYLCSVPFLTYIAGAKFAWNYKNDGEIIISNSTYSYSWAYSVRYKMWFKISEVFESFFNDFPRALGNRQEAGVYHQYDLTEESYTLPVTVHLETRPLKLSDSSYKKLNRLLVRGRVDSNEYNIFSVNLFGSVDGVTWYLLNDSTTVQEKNPLLIGRSQFSCKYYILLLGGKVEETANLIALEVDFSERYNNKLR